MQNSDFITPLTSLVIVILSYIIIYRLQIHTIILAIKISWRNLAFLDDSQYSHVTEASSNSIFRDINTFSSLKHLILPCQIGSVNLILQMLSSQIFVLMITRSTKKEKILNFDETIQFGKKKTCKNYFKVISFSCYC